MKQCESVVVYDGLPIGSGGAHGINRLTPGQALQAWRGFLDSCGQAPEVHGMFRVDNGPGPPADSRVKTLLDETFPSQGRSIHNLRPVPQSRIDEAVELISAISPQPADRWGNAAVSLFLDAQFLLRNPGGTGPWPGQERALFGDFETPTGVPLGVSSVRLGIGNSRSMGLMLTIPSATDADVGRLHPWLQEHLPFRLSSKHWTRWTLNKNGKSYRPKRLQLT